MKWHQAVNSMTRFVPFASDLEKKAIQARFRYARLIGKVGNIAGGTEDHRKNALVMIQIKRGILRARYRDDPYDGIFVS